MKINVPLIRQPKGSKDCGIAGLAMIYAYYKKNKTFEDLKKEITIYDIGTYAPQLGSHLIKDGFKVKITTYHPGLVCKAFKEVSQKEIYDELLKLKESYKDEKNKMVIQFFLDFINNGGEIEIKIPSKEDLIEELNNKRPIGVLMTTGVLYGNKPLFNFHFVIVTGIEDNKIIVNDPMPDKRGGIKEYKLDEFFYGVYASAYGDLDNASFIKIRT
ncbi:MAG: C39 family peptidase [Nanoarchaeota archaeon]